MNIEWAVTCRYAEGDGTRANLMGVGTDVLIVQQIPGPVGTFLAVRMAASRDEMEPGQTHVLTGQVYDPGGEPVVGPDGQPAAPLQAQFGAERPVQQLVPGFLINPLVTFGVQWWVTEAGSYSIALQVNGGEEHRYPVHVLDVNDMPEPS